MCGISGIFQMGGLQGVDPLLLSRMTDLIRHRGPDDEGFVLWQGNKLISYSGPDSTPEVQALYPDISTAPHTRLGMGFRRLSILELSVCGHQPMVWQEAGLAISFNGEIYNYLELMQELKDQGYTFSGHSDTELILKAYQHWGETCVTRFVGMWAFALWDNKKQMLLMSRDRFGIKPLYYARNGDLLYWASEIKQLLICPINKELNNSMIHRSMKINSLLVYEDQTFFSQIKLLKPGHNLIFEAGKQKLHKYYDLDCAEFETSSLSLNQAIDKYRELFTESIKLHLRSDVEVSASLSGGLDSSAIMCEAHRQTGLSMQSFSSYYSEDPSLDERTWIELVVQKTNARPHFVSPTARDAASWLEKINWYNDLPTKAGYASQWAVLQAVRRNGIKVVLSGQGSDELFAGYKHSIYRYLADEIRNLKWSKMATDFGIFYKDQSYAGKISSMAKVLLSTLLSESKLYKLEFDYYRFEPFNQSFIRQSCDLQKESILAGIRDIPASRLSNFLYNMVRNTSLQTLLHLEDRMASANSIESRVPFLDHRIVDFAFSLPSDYKINNATLKYIHRAAIKDLVPPEIFHRKDKGIYSSPFYQVWMRGELRSMISDVFSSREFRQRGIWNLPMIQKHWKQYLNGKQTQVEMLFNCLSLEIWFRRFKDYL